MADSDYKHVFTDVDGTRYYQYSETGDIYYRSRCGDFRRAGFTAEQNVYREIRQANTEVVAEGMRRLSNGEPADPATIQPSARATRYFGRPGHCFDIDGGWWHEPGTCPGAVMNCDGKCCGVDPEPSPDAIQRRRQAEKRSVES